MTAIDLLDAFISWQSCRNMGEQLVANLDKADPAIAVLALEGLYHIESNVDRRQFRNFPTGRVKSLLRKWRCESQLDGAYCRAFVVSVPRFLRSLTIFKTLEVPLFIDNYGEKKLLSSYGSQIEDIDINGETPIYHVTHREEAQNIAGEKRLKPSDNKNIIEGCWFGQLDNNTDKSSVYGSKAFETTLSRLGVTGLHQGEVVSYKNEVNVILYAADDGEAGFSGLKKPKLTVDEVERRAYVKVSIFVPSGVLPKTDAGFDRVFSGPFDVEHSPFCVKALRLHRQSDCAELQ